MRSGYPEKVMNAPPGSSDKKESESRHAKMVLKVPRECVFIVSIKLAFERSAVFVTPVDFQEEGHCKGLDAEFTVAIGAKC